MFHTVNSCPLTKLNGGLSLLNSADEDAVSWLTNYGVTCIREEEVTENWLKLVASCPQLLAIQRIQCDIIFTLRLIICAIVIKIPRFYNCFHDFSMTKTIQYLERPKYKNCNESQSHEVNGVGSIPVWSGGMDFEEI